ncbi:MAG: 2-oxo acid dehydrogenase subunit E2 [Deltaproteobacteria bacterium]|nr:2-oxo acid dehydrogenase subunit E2 [Deltaproteobacteria bacterium]
MPNLNLELKKDLSSFRRIAIGTWRDAYDPSIYGTLRLRADKVLGYLDEFRARTGKRLTITHLMAKAVAIVMAEMPDANAVLRFNRIYLRKDIGVFFQVAMEDPINKQVDLSGATIFDAHKKSFEEIVDEFEARVAKVRAGKDKELEGTRSTFKKIPYLFLNKFLQLLSLFSFSLNLDLRFLGIPKDPFGSAMVTNVGSLGLEEAYVPLVPYSKVPLLIAVGAVQDVPVVEDGRVVPGKVLNACATIDHRVLDGMHASHMSKTMRKIFEDPERWLGALPTKKGVEPAVPVAASPA